MDAIGYFGDNHWLAVKPGKVYIFVSSDNDAFGVFHILCREHIFGPVCTLGLNLDGNTHFLALLFQALCGHKSVGNPSRAGGDGQHPVAVLGLL